MPWNGLFDRLKISWALRMRIFRLAILLLILLATTQTVRSAEIAKEKITFAYASISPSMSAVWMAKEIGAFERNGLNAELVYISSGATTIQALVGGSVQAALGASNAVVAATLKGAPIIAVGGNSSRPGMQLWVQPEIQRAEQLQGKTLAITRFGSTSDFVTRLILRKLNLEGRRNCASSAAWWKPIWVFVRGRQKDESHLRRRGRRQECWWTLRSSAFLFQ
jgi:ABC-type nitrate/sulfonate/bicarbonate transport system substrate-binding protein